MTQTKKGFIFPEYLVETDWLEQHLGAPKLLVFDCSVNAELNPDPELSKRFPFVFESGRLYFEEGHIPGSGFIDILNELSDKSSKLPLMMPPETQFVDTISKYGIGDDSHVVLYSALEPMWAARAWWMLRAFGFDKVAILNGGWAKWTAEGRPVSKKACAYRSGQFTARPRPGTFVGKAAVLAAISDNEVCTINALRANMHAGAGGPVFGRKGRIAGSVNVPAWSLRDPDTDVYLPSKRLQEKFDAVGVGKAQRIITYCGGGIVSSEDAFVLTLLGYENVAVYDASMFEWGNDESLPMETG